MKMWGKNTHTHTYIRIRIPIDERTASCTVVCLYRIEEGAGRMLCDRKSMHAVGKFKEGKFDSTRTHNIYCVERRITQELCVRVRTLLKYVV